MKKLLSILLILISFISVSQKIDNPIIDKPDKVKLDLTHSLIQERGFVTPEFSRNSTGTIKDFEGVIHTAKVNEIRFEGARRVENCFNISEFKTLLDLGANSGVTIDPVQIGQFETSITYLDNSTTRFAYAAFTPILGVEHVFSAFVEMDDSSTPSPSTSPSVGDFTFIMAGQLSANNIQVEQVAGNLYRVSANYTPTAPGGNWGIIKYQSQSVKGFRVNGYQLEKATGTQTTASEYVSNGVGGELGKELVVNGDFDTDTDWIKGIDWTIGNGYIESVGNGTLGFLNQDFGAVVGKTYRFDYEVLENTLNDGGSIGLSSVGVFGFLNIPATVGKHTLILLAINSSPSFDLRIFRNSTNISGLIRLDNVSVKEAYFHGANVDGVKCFNADRDGNKISDDTLKGFLNESQSTNFVLQSEHFDNAAWTNTWGGGVTITTDDAIAPDGTKTADKLTQIDAIGDGNQQGLILSANTTYNTSTYFKNVDAARSRFWIYDNNATATLADVVFEWTGGVPSTNTSSGASNINYEAINNGWYKISFTFTTAAVVTTNNIILVPERQLAETNSIYVWGAQVEESPFPTSYIPTEATTVTRTADLLTADNTARDILPNSFTIALTVTTLGDGADYENTDIRLFGSQDIDGDGNEIRTVGGNIYEYIPSSISPNGGGIFKIDVADIQKDTSAKYAFQLKQEGVNVRAKIYKDGVQKYEGLVIQTLDHSNQYLEIGGWEGNVFGTNVKDVKIWSGDHDLPNSLLRAVTLNRTEPEVPNIFLKNEFGQYLTNENFIILKKD